MRLLNATTLELETFLAGAPPYCILSHRWTDHEVTFQDITRLGRDVVELRGSEKLSNAARLARELGLDYLWIDTCCIDKASSSELSEAINSMFRWYQESAKCIVYLADVIGAHYTASTWFTRGWTLQELIAPAEVVFYGQSWEPIGTKVEMAEGIEFITKIPQSVLIGNIDLSKIPACAKMSWAADRVTTAAEDIAYCLLGLFDVNMPLLYGEGAKKSFRRLQEAYVQQADDESIFAWTTTREEAESRPYWGLFAESPRFFRDSSAYMIPRFKIWRQEGHAMVSSRGVRISMLLARVLQDESNTLFLAPLNCLVSKESYYSDNHDESDIQSAFTIILQHLSSFEDVFARIRPDITRNMGRIKAAQLSDPHGDSAFPRFQFVPSSPVATDPVMGFSFSTKQVIDFDFPTNSQDGPVVLQGRCHVRLKQLTPGAQQLDAMVNQHSAFEQRCSIELSSRFCLNPANFDTTNLRRKLTVATVSLDLTSVVNQQPPSKVQYTTPMSGPVTLHLGFEPLPDNTMGTPPGFVRPYYDFEYAEYRAEEHDTELSTLFGPAGCHLIVTFIPIVHKFRTFYDVKLKWSNEQVHEPVELCKTQ